MTRSAAPRTAQRHRRTGETDIRISLSLDDALEDAGIDVPDGFFAHMLDALRTHGGIGLSVRATGDTDVDLHHTVEDTGIVLGEALAEALGERRGIVRFAHAYAPLDEALARAVIDLSGRGHFVHDLPASLAQAWIKPTFPLDLIVDFFQAFADRGRFTFHLDVLRARSAHHAAEAAFKATAVALRSAIAIRGDGDRVDSVPSTKGTLDR